MSWILKSGTPDAENPGQPKFIKNEPQHTQSYQQIQFCRACSFYREVVLKSGQIRKLCQLTGEKRPAPGLNGCFPLAGKWEDLDAILGLTQRSEAGKKKVPNLVRPCSGLDRFQDGQKVAMHYTAINTIADLSGNRALHIGRAQRPGSGNTRAASLRPGSVGSLPFCF